MVQRAPALELRRVHAGYGRIEVLRDVSLQVPAGSVVALLGPNGAGKTTTLAVAAGRVVPTTGCLHVAGRHVNRVDVAALARAGVCTVPEGRGVFPNLSVRDNLRMATYSGCSLADAEAIAYARFPRLGERRTQLAGTMSGGEQQMLAMARALVGDPAVLLLDELSMGLAPMVVAQLYEEVRAIAATGVSVLVVEQFARTVLGVADHAVLLVHGEVRAVGTPDEIESELTGAYLGVRG